MKYGNQHWLAHLIRSVALFTIGCAVVMALFLTIQELTAMNTFTQDEAGVISGFFELLGWGTVAIFAWSFVEFAAAVWSIKYVRVAAVRIRSTIVGGDA